MKRYRIWIAVGLLLLPLIARTLWYYRGLYTPGPVETPDYSAVGMPTPPLSTPEKIVAPAGRTKPVILLDLLHKNQFTLPELAALTERLTASGAQLEVVDGSGRALGEALKYADAYVTIAPLTPFTAEETRLLQHFAARGGRLLVIADPTRNGVSIDWLFGFVEGDPATDVIAANSLLRPFDLAFVDDYLYNLVENEGNFRNVFLHPTTENPAAADFSTVVFYAAHSVATSTGTALLQGDDNTLSSRTDTGGALTAAALSADGQVLATGDLTFLTPPYNQVADNQRLIGHLSQFLLTGERTHDLEDFPFLFSRPVAVLPLLEPFQVNADVLKALGKWQAALKPLNIAVNLVEKPQPGTDLVVLGTYTPSQALRPYLELFNLDWSAKANDSSAEGQLELPGFGKLSRANTGVLLFKTNPTRTTVVLLADSPQLLFRFLELLAAGDLSTCTIQGELAACALTPASEESGSESTPSPETPTPSETPTPTPTPAGE